MPRRRTENCIVSGACLRYAGVMLSQKPWRAEAVIQLVAGVFVCLCLGMAAAGLLRQADVGGFRTPDDPGSLVLGTLSVHGAAWILILLFLNQHEVRLRDAFGWHQPGLKKNLLLAAGMIAVVLPFAWGMQSVCTSALQKIGWPAEDQRAVDLILNAKSIWLRAYLGVFAVVLAPVAEEFVFRGMLFPFVKQLGFPKIAWFGVSCLFALIHFNAPTFLPLFAFALAQTWLYDRTDNLLAPIASHALFNAANLVVLCCAK